VEAVQVPPALFLTILIASIVVLILIYFKYFRKKESDFSNAWLYVKIVAVIFAIVLTCLFFYFEVIEIWIIAGQSEAKTESWLFSLLNALLLGALLNVMGIFSDVKSRAFKYFTLFSVLLIAIAGFGYLGVKVIFNAPLSKLLSYREFQTNSADVSYFVLFNLGFFTLILFLSFLTEQEKG